MDLAKLKVEFEVKKAEMAKYELEYKIAERLADIERMKDHIKLQEERAVELKEKLKDFK